jgi:hypothetical protein
MDRCYRYLLLHYRQELRHLVRSTPTAASDSQRCNVKQGNTRASNEPKTPPCQEAVPGNNYINRQISVTVIAVFVMTQPTGD